MKLGMSRAEAFDQIGMPDTEEYMSLQASQLQAVKAQINRIIISKSLNETIDPLFDQKAARDEALNQYAQYLKQAKPNEQVLDLLRNFIDSANIPVEQTAAPAPQQSTPQAQYAQQDNMLG